MAKRRILEKLNLTEISGVNKPCQEGALVTIMKKAPDASVLALEARIKKLNEQVGNVAKAWSENAKDAALLAQNGIHRYLDIKANRRKKLLTAARRAVSYSRNAAVS